MAQEISEQKKQAYNEYVKQVTPVHNTPVNMIWAFLAGGIICTIGEALNHWFTQGMSLSKEDAAAWTLIILVGTSILLTGLNIFQKLAKVAGAGVLVPITGFANSVASPAIEYKKEGHVFGIGCKIFTIAGPVILFGTFTSWILGVIYYIWQLL